MAAPLDCPGIECWQELFNDTVPPDQREGYERHLETCPACQARLDRDEGCAGLLRGWGQRVGDPTLTPVDPTLSQVLERLRHEVKSPLRTTATEPLDLYFLHPSDQPGVLGVLGAYEVQEVIGQGGMGIVLKAFDPALHRLVAIKVLAPALAGSATARRRFTREAQAAAAVCHDNIVPVYGVHEEAGLPYLVMQYVAGESLQDRLDRCGPLELVDVVRIGLQTAAGLAAAHAQGLIHRDIKPANLLLENGLARVKITDFGLARSINDVRLTQNGVVAGTPEYMAPEQARGEPVDHRADLFSLGSVLYALCTGVPPFRGSTAMAVLHQVSNEAPTPIRALNPEVPAWLEALVVRLLAKAPADRLQSAAEIARLLEGYLAHLQQPTQVSAPQFLPLPGQGSQGLSSRGFLSGRLPRISPRAWLLLLLAALGLGLGFWFLGGGGPDGPTPETAKAPPAWRHLAFDFRTGIANYPALSLYGPETETVVKTDAEGLRITLPAGRGDTNPVGVEMSHRLRGDFDVVVGYELLAVGDPVPQYGAGVALRVSFDTPSALLAVVGRARKPVGERFGAHKILKGPDGKEQYQNNAEVKATRSRGKLRLVRTGPQLQYLVAEEGLAFKTIQTVEVGTDDVQALRLNCHTMYTPIALDVRLTELTIDADQFPNGMPSAQAPAAQAPAAPAEAPPVPPRKGLLTAIVLAVLTLLVVAALGVWLYTRKRSGARAAGGPPAKEPASPLHHGKQPEPAPVAVAFQCPQCGKTSKARAELGGKKIKCPRCGQPVLVPATSPSRSSRTPS